MSHPALSRAFRLAVFALALVGGLAGILVLYFHLVDDPLSDFRAYYDAATRLNTGRPLYLPEIDPFDPAYYRYPPLLAILMRPFAALLPYHVAAVLWLALLVGATVLTVRVLGPRRQATWLAMGLLGIPIAWALAIGQAQVLITLLLAVAAPWSVALAAQLKVLPVLAALYWVGRRDWRALGRFLAFTTALVAFQLVLAPSDLIAFPGVLGPEHVGAVRNISPYVISPILWLVLVLVGSIATVVLARTRWGWAAAVSLSVLATPRLLVYILSSLWAAVRRPEPMPAAGPAVAASRRADGSTEPEPPRA